MNFARHLEIILDARMIMHSGIGSHIRGLLEGWREIAPDFRPTLLGDPEAIEESGGRFGPRHVITFRAPIYGLREQMAFPAKACRGKLLHCPHYNVALPHRGPLVVTLHDLIHIHDQWGVPSAWKRLYGRWMLRQAVRRAGHIFTVSHCTAEEIAERLKVDREKISVAYNAPSRLFREADPSPEAVAQFRRKHELPEEYLLTVGLYKPHKNLDRLLEALHSLWREGDLSAPLVMAGVQAKDRPALEARIASLEIGDRARVLDRLPAEDLPLLYRGAHAMIHASLVEGFGLPIVEAQCLGTPVAASRSSAVPEVAGKGAIYFDPLNRDDMARRIAEVAGEEALRSRLAAAGRENILRFSWRETAHTVLSVYERLA